MATNTPLTFTAVEANSSVKLTRYNFYDELNLEYSTNGIVWQTFNVDTTYALANVGDYMMLRAPEGRPNTSGTAYSYVEYHTFEMTGKVAASGNIMSLYDRNAETTSMGEGAFAYLFRTCTSLTQAPELPATTLANNCYRGMFAACTSLTAAPELPATTLASSCYYQMLANCTSLTAAPELPATKLAGNSYYSMFKGCTNLAYVKSAAGYLELTDNDSLSWLSGTAPDGVYETTNPAFDLDIERGNTTVPVGWNITHEMPVFTGLRLISHQRPSTVRIVFGGPLHLEYSKDAVTWQPFNKDTDYTLWNSTDWMFLRAPEGQPNTAGFNGARFLLSGSFDVAGNIMSLYDCEGTTSAMTNDGFSLLFDNQSSLVDASKLKLPATTLADSCYGYMFRGCTSLTAAPELPATTLADSCYSNMFAACSSLTAAPVISAVSGAERSCEGMFRSCTSLQTATVCFDGTGTNGLYAFNMFDGCTSLNELFVPNLLKWKTNITLAWVQNVALEGTFHCNVRLGTNNTIERDTSRCPNNWNVVNYEYDQHDLSNAAIHFVKGQSGQIVLGDTLSALFTGSTIEPGISAQIGDTALVEGTDYEITYSDNIGTNNIDDVSDAIATISGKGDYYGNYSRTFKIVSNNIQSRWCKLGSHLNLCNYTGQPIENKTSVTAEFKSDDGYGTSFGIGGSYTYENNTDIGTATTTITGTGIWSGAIEFQWKIVEMLPGALCFKKPSQTYTYFNSDLGNAKLAESYDDGQTWQAFNNSSWQSGMPTTRLIRADDENLTGRIRLYNTDTNQQLSVSGNPMMLRSVTREIEGDEQIGLLSNMFEGFVGLVDASELELPEEMGVSCCARMFAGCSRLVTSPTIPGTNLSTDCMREMFIGCSQLSSVKYDGSSDNLGDTYTKNWLSGVAGEGTFTYTDADFDRSIQRGPSTVPYNWLFDGRVVAFKNLYINDRIVKTMSINGNALLIGEIPPVRSLLDCTATIKQQLHTGEPLEPIPTVVTLTTKVKLQNGTDFEVIGWRDNVDIGTGYATIQGIGNYTGVVDVPFEIADKQPNAPLKIENIGTTQSFVHVSKYGDADASFVKSSDGDTWEPLALGTNYGLLPNEAMYIKAADVNEQLGTSTGSYFSIGANGGNLKVSGNAMSLYGEWADEMTEYGFYRMFTDDRSKIITDVSELELPATQLAPWCYSDMFREAQGINDSPVLPATTLVDNCYDHMFYGANSMSSVTAACDGLDLGAQTSDSWLSWTAGMAQSKACVFRATNPDFNNPSSRTDSTIPFSNWTIEKVQE